MLDNDDYVSDDEESQHTAESKKTEHAIPEIPPMSERLTESAKNFYEYASNVVTDRERLVSNLGDLVLIGLAGAGSVLLSGANYGTTIGLASLVTTATYAKEMSRYREHQNKLNKALEEQGKPKESDNTSLKEFGIFSIFILAGLLLLIVYGGLSYFGASPPLANASIALATVGPSLARKAMVARKGYQADIARAEADKKVESNKIQSSKRTLIDRLEYLGDYSEQHVELEQTEQHEELAQAEQHAELEQTEQHEELAQAEQHAELEQTEQHEELAQAEQHAELEQTEQHEELAQAEQHAELEQTEQHEELAQAEQHAELEQTEQHEELAQAEQHAELEQTEQHEELAQAEQHAELEQTEQHEELAQAEQHAELEQTEQHEELAQAEQHAELEQTEQHEELAQAEQHAELEQTEQHEELAQAEQHAELEQTEQHEELAQAEQHVELEQTEQHEELAQAEQHVELEQPEQNNWQRKRTSSLNDRDIYGINKNHNTPENTDEDINQKHKSLPW